jgi:two-component system NarL family sensor kinase
MRVQGGRAGSTRRGARRELTLTVGFAVLVLVLVGLSAGFATRSVAQRQALNDAERTTRRLADLVVAPLLGGFLSGDSERTEDLDRAIADRLVEGSLTEVTVWQGDGRVLYSDKAADIGKQVPPPEEVALALQGITTSGVQSGAPEADEVVPPAAVPPGEQPQRFVEVYVPFLIPDRAPLVFEAYYDYERVDHLARQLMMQTIPLVIAPLLLLQLIQIPSFLSLARRLRRHENERTRLLERGLATADQERARFAADLHDGPIQDLAGISYALGAVAPTVPDRQAPLMLRVQEALQRSIESLRGLMTDLYPPDLHARTLTRIISDLADPLRADGVTVELEAADLPALSTESVAALYRVGKESLVNIHKHAQASEVRLTLSLVAGDAPGEVHAVRFVVQDDGVGIEEGRVDRRAEGHLGLRLLSDRVESLGGRLEVVSEPGRGTRVEADVPVRPTFTE